MKKLFLLVACYCLYVSAFAQDVPSDGGYICQFRESEVSDQVHYNKRGRWVCTIAGYDAEKLPAAVRDAVLNCYEGYRITYVHEISVNANIPVYLINIETLSKIRIIRVAGDDIEEVRHMDKVD